MVNKTPIVDLPSIDEFIVEPPELPSVSQFLPEEVVEEEVQTIEDADGNAFLEVEDVINSGADWIHFDVMDNHYVPNLTIGPEVIKDIRKCTEIPFDVHLMITPVNPLLEDFAKSGSDIITFHPEAEDDPKQTIQMIKSFGCKVGISLNPATKINVLDNIIDDIDLVLVMTVVPGFGGQSFMHDQLEKIENIRKLIDATGKDIELEVDLSLIHI